MTASEPDESAETVTISGAPMGSPGVVGTSIIPRVACEFKEFSVCAKFSPVHASENVDAAGGCPSPETAAVMDEF